MPRKLRENLHDKIEKIMNKEFSKYKRVNYGIKFHLEGIFFQKKFSITSLAISEEQIIFPLYIKRKGSTK